MCLILMRFDGGVLVERNAVHAEQISFGILYKALSGGIVCAHILRRVPQYRVATSTNDVVQRNFGVVVGKLDRHIGSVNVYWLSPVLPEFELYVAPLFCRPLVFARLVPNLTDHDIRRCGHLLAVVHFRAVGTTRI